MLVKNILADKGSDVETMMPDRTLADAVQVLARRRIGAIVVTKDEGRIAGILSERDIVRILAGEGPGALDKPISAAMTAKVQVCHENNSINDVMEIMTAGRFRHLPVERDGILVGIISIGDVVKRRIEQVEHEAQEIRNYIATA
ncbi:CBS domain-containing protein [Aquibium sp. ELW1220]|jgi:CBS domain-containing protein|uniref:CBS domain-containing protein n=1 Tax=Aquibium sp. ELW1220 TaxID=2976766 RepID=UPI0025AF5219|nr:CBS domain-containing protein [Aquibium sp. ELW1220]MDN2579237.1 CBS domain-containing protein [Aquibium sp. ELW1220]